MANLNTLKNVDIRTVDKSTLTDISSVKINPNDSPEKKMKDYIDQIKNPYCFLCNGYAVKVEFANTARTIEDCFSDYIENLILANLYKIIQTRKKVWTQSIFCDIINSDF